MIPGDSPPRFEHEGAVGEGEADLPQPYPHRARHNVRHRVQHDRLKAERGRL